MSRRKRKKSKYSVRPVFIYAFLASLAFLIAGVVVSDDYIPDPKVRLQMSVVKLTTSSGKSGGGTGFVVQADSGKPVTVSNYHVCIASKTKEAGNSYMWAHRTNEFEEVKTKVLEMDAPNDLCILEAVPGFALKIGRKPPRFSDVLVMGHPLLKELTPVTGAYVGEVSIEVPFEVEEGGNCPLGSGPQVGFFGPYCLMPLTIGDTTAIIFPGNSGSPVVDASGDVVGVMESTDTRTNWGGFIPARFLKTLLGKY